LESRKVVPKEEVENKNAYRKYSRYKYLFKYLPEDERLRRYMEARNRIFADHELSGMRIVSRRDQKARGRFRIKRSRRREVVAAAKRIDFADPRLFDKMRCVINRTTGVSKPGKDRFCLDAQKLNALTIKDAYPLRSIEGILTRMD